MKPIAACFLLLPVLLLNASTTQQRGSDVVQGSRPGRWAHDGVHIVVDGKWRDPLTWKEVEPVPRPHREKRINTKQLFRKAVVAAGGDWPNGFVHTRDPWTTIPRTTLERPTMRTSADGSHAVGVFAGDL